MLNMPLIITTRTTSNSLYPRRVCRGGDERSGLAAKYVSVINILVKWFPHTGDIYIVKVSFVIIRNDFLISTDIYCNIKSEVIGILYTQFSIRKRVMYAIYSQHSKHLI